LKLEFYGVKGKAKLLFKSYLSNRYQRVVITNTNLNPNEYSTWGRIRHGVPQVSILGPLLFLLYINDLPKIINDKTVLLLFADDTSLLVTSSNYDDLHQKLNTAFHDINEWFKANQLSINFNKTHSIQFTASNNNSLIEIKVAYDKKQITSLSNIRFLGIYIDDRMSWKHHPEQISPKLDMLCYIIRTIKPYTYINGLLLLPKFYYKL
jgi:hypothetical protein